MSEAKGSHAGGRGFREVSHTADVAIDVWAPDLESLFAEAACGFNAVAGAKLTEGARLVRDLSLQDLDDESLLVAFLTDLVYAQEQERLGFDVFDLRISDHRLVGTAHGAGLLALMKPIKAVTYHGLEIHPGRGPLEVQIVFDV